MRLRLKAFHVPWRVILSCLFCFSCLLWADPNRPAHSESLKTYVGTEACKDCHEKEYKSFITYSKKSTSFKSISIRKKGLTDDETKKCFECHTTGYGKPGGFTSEAETPHLKDAGCEVCHGPGSSHVKTGNPKEIKRHPTTKDCEACHNKDRVAAFNYKPLVYGGAH